MTMTANNVPFYMSADTAPAKGASAKFAETSGAGAAAGKESKPVTARPVLSSRASAKAGHDVGIC